jgi:membrane associated rhomboid family serine protease
MKGRLIFNPYTIQKQGQYFRFLTHGFIHADWQHLILNMLMLYFFGPTLETRFYFIFGNMMAPVVFVLFYLSAIVIASLPDYFRHQDFMGYSALGASGATSALLLAYIFFGPWEWFLYPPVPAILLAVGYLWYESRMDKKGGSNIAHNAHFWGAMYGIVFIFISALAFEPLYVQSFFQELLAGPKLPYFLQ